MSEPILLILISCIQWYFLHILITYQNMFMFFHFRWRINDHTWNQICWKHVSYSRAKWQKLWYWHIKFSFQFIFICQIVYCSERNENKFILVKINSGWLEFLTNSNVKVPKEELLYDLQALSGFWKNVLFNVNSSPSKKYSLHVYAVYDLAHFKVPKNYHW